MPSLIAAILPHGNRLSGIAGRNSGDGSVEVLAYASRDVSSSMHRGIVRNVEQVAAAIKEVKQELEKQSRNSIAQVYTAVDGLSLHSVGNTVIREQDEETVVLQTLVDSINDENGGVSYEGYEILDVVPQGYVVDNFTTDAAAGNTGRRIEAHYLNLVARREMGNNLQESFKRAGVKVVDTCVTPLLQAKALLTDEEKKKGCALIEIADHTTTVSVYKKGILRYLITLPLGYHHVVRDLCTSFRFEEEEALKWLKERGDARYTETEDQEAKSFTSDAGNTIALAEFNNVVGARAEEIMANAWNLISRYSGLADELNAGVILAGVGSELAHIDQAFPDQVRSTTFQCRIAGELSTKLKGKAADAVDDNMSALIGLLLIGEEECAVTKPKTPKTPIEEPNLPVEPTGQGPVVNEPIVGTDGQDGSKRTETGTQVGDKGPKEHRRPKEPKETKGSGGPTKISIIKVIQKKLFEDEEYSDVDNK